MTTTLEEILRDLEIMAIGLHGIEGGKKHSNQAYSAIVKELEQVREAMITINPWCEISHKHVTCDAKKVNDALTHLDKFLGKK